MSRTTQKQWTVQGTKGFESLTYHEDASIPKLSDNEVLVKFHGASINYRDLTIAQGDYPFPTADGVVPGSDGAGEIIDVGAKVTRFQIGDRVATLFSQEHLSGPLTPRIRMTGLGGQLDGTLRQYGAFTELGVVKIPKNLDYLEAGTLSCAALTAWNAFYGIGDRALKPGDYVLTQGTGGVSMFAVQFAKAAGAKVIATTSSAAKAEKLKKLGADHVINYKEEPNWGEVAKSFTGDQEGVAHVVEVGGATTVAQSLKAIRMEGVISIIGYVGGQTKEQPTFLDALLQDCIVRGIQIGSREQFEAMNRAIEANDIRPVVDDKIFALSELKEAYQYMWDQKHFGKLRIKIDH